MNEHKVQMADVISVIAPCGKIQSMRIGFLCNLHKIIEVMLGSDIAPNEKDMGRYRRRIDLYIVPWSLPSVVSVCEQVHNLERSVYR